MPKVVRWTVPASLPCYGDWDFHIHPGTFDLFVEPVVAVFREYVNWRRWYYSRNRKRESGYRSYLYHIAALDWLEDSARRSDLVVWEWEPVLVWHLASKVVYTCQWSQVRCPSCAADYPPGSGRVAEWSIGWGLAAEGGRRYVCPAGHTLYAIGDWNS
jgi:hypothetical protein